jgi:hypothetical protein
MNYLMPGTLATNNQDEAYALLQGVLFVNSKKIWS